MKRIKYSNSEHKSNHGCLRQNFTYKCSGKGTLEDCLLRAEMVHPDSMNVVYIETFSVFRKQMRYSSYVAHAWVGEKVRVCHWGGARDKISLHFST